MVALFNFNKTIEKVGTKWAQDGRGVGTIKNKLVSTILAFIVKYGALGGSRTHDLWLRKPTLYPAELRDRKSVV